MSARFYANAGRPRSCVFPAETPVSGSSASSFLVAQRATGSSRNPKRPLAHVRFEESLWTFDLRSVSNTEKVIRAQLRPTHILYVSHASDATVNTSTNSAAALWGRFCRSRADVTWPRARETQK